MRRVMTCVAGVIVANLLMTCCAYAEPTLNIWPGAAPGTENWTQKEQVVTDTPIGTVPLDSKATGTGVIIAPGGYCVALAIGAEGYDVARKLQERGIAAFVLKYRIPEKQQQGIPQDLDMDKACKYGIADAIQAIKVVRQHAAEWGMVASGALLQQDAAARPDFAALIYGAPFGVMPAIPAKLPPIFMAWAQDDDVAGDMVAGFYGKLMAAGDRPEAHIFSAGGHGFGVCIQGKSSDHWMDEFQSWLGAQGLAKPLVQPAQ
jgi:acetyl esterase/lipase